MRLYLDILGLWEYFEETVPCPRQLVLTSEQEKVTDWLDRRDERNKKVRKWHGNRQKGISVAISWCSEDIANDLKAKQLLQTNIDPVSDKPSDLYYSGRWTPKNMWTYLKDRFTAKNSSRMWAAWTAYEHFSAQNCKNIQELRGKVARISADIEEQKVTMKEALVMKVITTLGPAFATCVTIPDAYACDSDKLPSMDSLLMKLENEERWMNNGAVHKPANTVQGRRGRGRGRGGHGTG